MPESNLRQYTNIGVNYAEKKLYEIGHSMTVKKATKSASLCIGMIS